MPRPTRDEVYFHNKIPSHRVAGKAGISRCARGTGSYRRPFTKTHAHTRHRERSAAIQARGASDAGPSAGPPAPGSPRRCARADGNGGSRGPPSKGGPAVPAPKNVTARRPGGARPKTSPRGSPAVPAQNVTARWHTDGCPERVIARRRSRRGDPGGPWCRWAVVPVGRRARGLVDGRIGMVDPRAATWPPKPRVRRPAITRRPAAAAPTPPAASRTSGRDPG